MHRAGFQESYHAILTMTLTKRSWLLRICVVAGLFILSALLRHWFALPPSVTAETHLLQGNYDQAIRESTAIIEQYPGSATIAESFNRRGKARQGKGDLIQALADYGEAIRRQPDFSEAYFNRCNVLRMQADIDRAYTDCQRAAELKADYQQPRETILQIQLARGDVAAARQSVDELISLRMASGSSTLDYRFYRGQIELFYDDRPADAADDLAATLASALDYRETAMILGPQLIDGATVTHLMGYQHAFIPDAYYTVLWLRIARYRAQQYYATNFRENIMRLEQEQTVTFQAGDNGADKAEDIILQPWPGPVLNIYLRNAPVEEVRNFISTIDDPKVRLTYTCDLDFYLGIRAQEQGKADDAVSNFQSAAMRCPDQKPEYRFARAELQRLGAPAANEVKP